MRVSIYFDDGRKITKKTTKEAIDFAEAMAAGKDNYIIIPCETEDVFVPKSKILYIEFEKEERFVDENENKKSFWERLFG